MPGRRFSWTDAAVLPLLRGGTRVPCHLERIHVS